MYMISIMYLHLPEIIFDICMFGKIDVIGVGVVANVGAGAVLQKD